jgi:hypothetical protein
MHNITRRNIVYASAALAASMPFRQVRAADEPPKPAAETKSRSRLILLGTAGGPTPKPNRAAPAQVIVVNGASYVIDCGIP